MLPTVKRRGVGQCAGASPERVPSQLTDGTALWLRRHISALPAEVLSHIFNYLGCDDIAEVNDTCRQFRRVVHAHHWEALLFSQLPVLLRRLHRESLPLHKRLVQHGLHPFITELSTRERNISNAEQRAVVPCLNLQRRMAATSRYRLVEVLFSESFPRKGGKVVYSPTSSNMLIYFKESVFPQLFGQNHTGSWSKQRLGESVFDSYHRSLIGVNFSSNRRYLSFFSLAKTIQIYQFDSGSWQFNKRQRIEEGHWFEISPSGRYLVVVTLYGNINSIRRFDETVCWKSMPMPSDNKNNPHVQWCKFSHSEQHVAIKHKKKLVILSVNCQGRWKQSWETTWSRCINNVSLQFSPSEQYVAISYLRMVVILSQDSGGSWNISWESPSNRGIDYVEFSPSGSWLLIVFWRSVDVIGLDPAGKCISQQNLSPRNRQLTFSPAGKYLVSKEGYSIRLIWQLLKSGKWVFYGDITDPASPWCGETRLNQDTITFSSCDNYLFTSTLDGAVNFWGRNEQGNWMALCSEQHDYSVEKVSFSQSGVHALTVDVESIHIWGLNDSGLWTVKGVIPAPLALDARFHPVAEHLIVIRYLHRIRIVEIRAAQDPSHKEVNTRADGYPCHMGSVQSLHAMTAE